MTDLVLLGDEAIALGAIHAGLTAAYAYPGTPSTEILEYILRHTARHGRPHAAWTANEKTAYEEALGVSAVGRRAMVSMKHVGLNVAADPFMNSALLTIQGGLVVVVADDPGMHSSQNEQDSRYFADFARVPCLEPANQQEAYEMTREAFDLSERFHVPILIRIVTRLAHSRANVRVAEPRAENPLEKKTTPEEWILLPSHARRQWRSLLDRQKAFLDYTTQAPHNLLTLNEAHRSLGVITTGLGRNYYMENVEDLAEAPSHLHIGAYPVPVEKIRTLGAHVDRLLVLEEGYPFVERYLRGLIPPKVAIAGKESGEVPPDGELTPDIVRSALGLQVEQGVEVPGLTVPNRPPQLCAGCPHGDSFAALQKALKAFDQSLVTSDIGCYTLAALPPYSAVESCVCMGASVSMAKGAADAGFRPAVGVIGDSTFLHSGVTPLMDAVAANTDMTLFILDNEATAMTGGQPTLLPRSRIEKLVLGLGVDPAHVHVLTVHPKQLEANAAIIGQELEYRGLSVIIGVRECLETIKAKKQATA